MAGYLGTKAVLLSTTSATVGGDSTVGGDLTVDTNTLYVDSTNNRVGVGTASPSNPFQVGTSDLIVDSSGNVGIGTSSPTQLLTVGDTGTTYTRLQFYASTSGASTIHFGDGTSGADNYRGYLNYAHDSNSMQFATDGSERMRIDGSGLLFSSPTYSNTSGGSANVGIGASGEFYRSTSSRRYKNTINDATHGLAELLTLRPVTYKGNSDGDTIFGGLVAEEVHEAGLTEFVQYDEDGLPDALSYSNMVALCIKAIQEQQAKIEALEARVTALEGN